MAFKLCGNMGKGHRLGGAGTERSGRVGGIGGEGWAVIPMGENAEKKEEISEGGVERIRGMGRGDRWGGARRRYLRFWIRGAASTRATGGNLKVFNGCKVYELTIGKMVIACGNSLVGRAVGC